MEGLQGGFLSVKLKHLDFWNNQRRTAAATYGDQLAGSDVKIPTEMAHNRHVYHLYIVESENRDALRECLAREGVETGLHYPTPLHLQQAFHHLGHRKGSFPV